MPLDAVRVGVPIKLVAEVNEGLCGGDVEEVDGREVEDDGAEGRAGGDFLVVDDLAPARAGVVPGPVLGGIVSVNSLGGRRGRGEEKGDIRQPCRTC